jgi:2-iminobutanoate/2-iminopropanoate deaminase
VNGARQVFLPGVAPRGALVPATVGTADIFVSGQVGTDPLTGTLAGEGALEQAAQALENIRRILAVAGADPSDVVKVTLFVTRPEFVAEIDSAYRAFFGDALPARSAVTISALARPEFLVEIDAIASLSDQSVKASSTDESK